MPRANTNGEPGARKTRNITVDADVQEALTDVQDKLEHVFGFRPNLSQTVKFLIRSYADAAKPKMRGGA